MTGRARWSLGAVLSAAVIVSICSCSVSRAGHGDSRRDPSDASQMCDRLELPLQMMDDEGLTFEQVLTERGKEGVALRAGFALMGAGAVRGGERFRPSLEYVSDRWETESYEGRHPKPPSAEVIANARALDAFLAGGGCG